MNAAAYGQHLADQREPLTDAQVEAAARLFASMGQQVAA